MNGSGDSNQQQPQQMQHQQWVAMQQYQRQWMAMQYMQQQMIYNQHYMPYCRPQPYQQPSLHQTQVQSTKQNYQIQSSDEDNKTIWIGDLQQWMDESYLQSCFSQSGEALSVKIIRNKQTGQSERYGFVEFNSHLVAEKVLQSYNGAMMPNTEQPFRLNWAGPAGFTSGDRRPETGSDMSIFVGDLAPDVTDAILHDTFASRYPSVKGAKVVVDPSSGRAKGYGFVRFGDENEKSRAMTEMNGEYCSSRPMRIGEATPKKPLSQQQFSSQVLSGGYAVNGPLPQVQSVNDSPSSTIFVGGLDSEVTDEELRQYFIPFGEVVSIKIPAGKGCGFVHFTSRSDAEEAIQRVHGTVIGKQTVRLSWGRNPRNKESNGTHYGSQVYSNGYGYTARPAYGVSSNGYGNQQQAVSKFT